MRRTLRGVVAVLVLAALSRPVAAHAGSLSGEVRSAAVPAWLTVATGGVVIGMSFLVASLMTDHEAIREINARRLPLREASLPGVAATGLRAVGLAGLVVVLAAAFLGPTSRTSNFALLFVWGGWWAGYTMSVYLLGNSWPAINPWRTLARLVERAVPEIRTREYPERLGAWPSVVGLVSLVFLEVITPVATDPRLLGGVIVGYTLLTVAGATLYGRETWFDRVDPIARVFRFYGQIAPVQRTGDGLTLRFPTTALTDDPGDDRAGEVAFVVALLWVTTYDGLVTTPAYADVLTGIVSVGVPALAVYLATIVAGFAAFFGAYRLAARRVRTSAATYVDARFMERWFVPSLVPIAAGYHFAHYLGYFLSLWPSLVSALASPLGGAANPQVLVLPGWFGLVQLGAIVLGHVLAVWVAHALSLDLFPGTLAPIRSQYPFIAVMILYTMTSMWVILQPFTDPLYV